MNIERYISHFITLALLVLGAWLKSPAFAYASVSSLGLVMAKEVFDRLHALKEVKSVLPEDAKRLIQDINARVTTLEYGVKTRGF